MILKSDGVDVHRSPGTCRLQAASARPSYSLKPIMTVAGGANPVELVADLRDAFQVMRLRGAIGLVGGVGQFFDIAVPFRIERPLRNNQPVGGFRHAGGAPPAL